MNIALIEKLGVVAQLATTTRMKRLLHHPYRYILAMWHKKVIYPMFQKERAVVATLFFGKKMKVLLPASTDIYLTGGKSHASEIRLAHFLIRNLKAQDQFLDIGAHYGYFTLLAVELVGAQGRVIAFEPATQSFKVLQDNTAALGNVLLFNKAVSDVRGERTFYEFPNMYSEYNAMDITQFEKEPWFTQVPHKKRTVASSSMDTLYQEQHFIPAIIKIDVEGGEYAVIKGGTALLQEHAPLLVMEYLAPERSNQPHKQALALLGNQGYHPHIILDSGTLQPVGDIDLHLAAHQLESDNIVFKKL